MKNNKINLNKYHNFLVLLVFKMIIFLKRFEQKKEYEQHNYKYRFVNSKSCVILVPTNYHDEYFNNI